MPQTPPQLPPPNRMIQELKTPNPVDTSFSELVDRNSPRWIENNPIKPGTLYKDLKGADPQIARAFPELYFLSESVPIGSNTVAGMPQHNFVRWNWMTDVEGESSYNADISYLGESISNPVYARTYMVRRDDYDEDPTLATAIPLRALIGIRIIKGGRDYSHAEATFVGAGSDSGAKVAFILSEGSVIKGIVEVEGDDFDETSSIQIIGDGTEAECQPIIQPEGSVLTSQKKVEFSDDDPRQAEFVKVLRLYEFLPGPYLPFTRYDDDLGPIQGRRRAVLNTGQLGGTITPISKTNYEARDGSSVVSWEIQEFWTDGSGDADNPQFPTLSWSSYNDERGAVLNTSQILVGSGFSDTAIITRPGGGKIRKVWFEPYADNPNLIKRRSETWVEVVIRDIKMSSERGGGLIAVDEDSAEPGSQIPDSGPLVTASYLRTISPDQQIKHSEFLYGLNSWPILPGSHTDEKTGIILNYTKQWIPARTPRPPRSGYRGPFVEDQVYDDWNTIRIITAPDITSLPGPEAWESTRPFNLPPTLWSIQAIWSDVVSKSAQATRANSSANRQMVVEVSSGSSGGIIVTSGKGFRGKARCIIARDYKYGQFTAAEVPTPLRILPSSGSVVLTSTSSTTFSSGSDDETGTGTLINTASVASSIAAGRIGDTFHRQVQSLDVRDHLIGSFRIEDDTHISQWVTARAQSQSGKFRQVVASGTGSFMTVSVPQSNPTPDFLRAIPDKLMLDDVVLEEWGYGIWIMWRFYVDLTGIV